MNYDKLLEDGVGTVDATSDHFEQLFSLSTNEKTTGGTVWAVAWPSNLSAKDERIHARLGQIRYERLRSLKAAIEANLARKAHSQLQIVVWSI